MTDSGQYEMLGHIPYNLGIGVAVNCILTVSSVDPEVTILTPTSAPAVSTNPVIQNRG